MGNIHVGVLAVGDSNSQCHKKYQNRASSEICQLGDKNLILGQKIFPNFVGGKNVRHFSALNDLK